MKYYDSTKDGKDFIAFKCSYVDIQAVTSLQFLVRLNKINIEDYENLSRYTNDIGSRPTFQHKFTYL